MGLSLIVRFLILDLLVCGGYLSSVDANAGGRRRRMVARAGKKAEKCVGPTGHRHLSVDVAGGGDFVSVQAAVDAVPENNTVNVIIHIAPGYYM